MSLSQRHKPLATKYMYIINLKSTGTMYICLYTSVLLVSVECVVCYRCLAYINPDRGTKTQPKQGKKTHGIPAKVLRLVNQLGAFVWHARDC